MDCRIHLSRPAECEPTVNSMRPGRFHFICLEDLRLVGPTLLHRDKTQTIIAKHFANVSIKIKVKVRLFWARDIGHWALAIRFGDRDTPLRTMLKVIYFCMGEFMSGRQRWPGYNYGLGTVWAARRIPVASRFNGARDGSGKSINALLCLLYHRVCYCFRYDFNG